MLFKREAIIKSNVYNIVCNTCPVQNIGFCYVFLFCHFGFATFAQVSPPSGSLSSAGVKFRSILTRLTDLWDEYELQEDEQGFEDSGEQPTENITLILSNLQQGTWQAELQVQTEMLCIN